MKVFLGIILGATMLFFWETRGGIDKKTLPRYAILKTDEVNVRVGPGDHFPIKFVFNRQFWPVKITHEFEDWRKIIDQKKNEGWVHRRTLSGKNYVVIIKNTVLHKENKLKSSPIAKVEKGVHALFKKCDDTMCKIEITFHGELYKGWVEKKFLWGVPT